MPVPNTFGTATSAIPLSQLDANFATPITIGNTAVQLGNTVTTLNNMTLANVTISSGTITITNVAVTTANVSGTANVSTLVVVGNATVGGNTTVGGNVTLSGGTANGVAYLNTSKQVITGSALTFDGTNFGLTLSQDAATKATLTNSNGGTSASARYEASNGSNTAEFGIRGTAQTTNGVLVPQVGYAYSPSAAGLALVGGAGPVMFAASGTTEGMRLTSTSLYTASTINVGIGTSSPNSKLQVNSGTNLGGVLIGFNSTSANFYDADSQYWRTGNGTGRMTLDSSGNLGLTAAQSAWTTYKVLQVGNASLAYNNNNTYIGANWFYDGTNKYIAADHALLYSQENGVHGWFTAPSGAIANDPINFTQAMTLDASGNLLVGTTATSVTGSSGFRYLGGGRIAVTDSASTNATTTYEAYSTGAGAFRFYVGLGGTIFATSITITAISDERLKENVRNIDTGLDAIMALKPRRFDWKEGKGQDKKNVAGFIAQEFETVFPECVSTSKAGEDGIEYKNINHETLIPTLVKAMQEQQALITQLIARITALESA